MIFINSIHLIGVNIMASLVLGHGYPSVSSASSASSSSSSSSSSELPQNVRSEKTLFDTALQEILHKGPERATASDVENLRTLRQNVRNACQEIGGLASTPGGKEMAKQLLRVQLDAIEDIQRKRGATEFRLPTDKMAYLFGYLPTSAVARTCALVCRDWYQLTRSPLLEENIRELVDGMLTSEGWDHQTDRSEKNMIPSWGDLPQTLKPIAVRKILAICNERLPFTNRFFFEIRRHPIAGQYPNSITMVVPSSQHILYGLQSRKCLAPPAPAMGVAAPTYAPPTFLEEEET